MDEHPFRTIRKVVDSAVQTGAFPRLFLLYGAEELMVNWAVSYIKSNAVNPATESLDYTYFAADDADSSSVIAACETLPLMSVRRVVTVDAEKLFSATKNDAEGPSVQAITEYLPQLPESTILVLVCGKPNKTRALYKACEKLGLVFDFVPLDNGTLAGWMQKRIAAANLTADRQMMLDFAFANGYGDKDRNYNLYNLENDLRKVVAYAEGPVIKESDFNIAIADRMETDAFKMLDSAFSGNKEAAFRVLSDNLELSQPSKAMGVILSFTGLLCSQLEIMVEGAERKAEGQSMSMILSETGINKYRLQKAMAAAGNRTPSMLRRNLYYAYQVEKDIKSGTMDARTAMELFIAGL